MPSSCHWRTHIQSSSVISGAFPNRIEKYVKVCAVYRRALLSFRSSNQTPFGVNRRGFESTDEGFCIVVSVSSGSQISLRSLPSNRRHPIRHSLLEHSKVPWLFV